ncbi:MAG TPA: isochorismatase family protein [Kofleriaceae bacterium]|nr:isochorismatase family protein [Kofleriaceae bacterium]
MSRLEALSRARAALLVVDIQDRLLPAMPADALADVMKNTTILIQAAARLALPIVVSQQYPKGLGPTNQAIEDALAASGAAIHRFDKLEFSAAAAPDFAALAPRLARDQWIVCGMETHVCVYQTARDLAARGWAAHVCADAVCSRTERNFEIGLDLMERAGAVITSTEACVFDLLGRAGSDEFRALSKVIK